MEEQSKSKNFFDALSAGKIFSLGLVAGFLVLCTLGFFILLGVFLFGDSASGETQNINTNNANNNEDEIVNKGDTKINLRAVDPDRDNFRGDEKAPITIVEYSDFECPFCKRFHDTLLQIAKDNGNKVAWVFRHFPLDGLHSQARTEALASECAAEQGKFWEFADIIFAVTPSNDGLDLNKLPDYAKQAGVSVNKFNDCLNSKKYANRVAEDQQDGQSIGVSGTPFSVIIGPNGETLPVSGAQPAAVVQQMIDSLL